MLFLKNYNLNNLLLDWLTIIGDLERGEIFGGKGDIVGFNDDLSKLVFSGVSELTLPVRKSTKNMQQI